MPLKTSETVTNSFEFCGQMTSCHGNSSHCRTILFSGGVVAGSARTAGVRMLDESNSSVQAGSRVTSNLNGSVPVKGRPKIWWMVKNPSTNGSTWRGKGMHGRYWEEVGANNGLIGLEDGVSGPGEDSGEEESVGDGVSTSGIASSSSAKRTDRMVRREGIRSEGPAERMERGGQSVSEDDCEEGKRRRGSKTLRAVNAKKAFLNWGGATLRDLEGKKEKDNGSQLGIGFEEEW